MVLHFEFFVLHETLHCDKVKVLISNITVVHPTFLPKNSQIRCQKVLLFCKKICILTNLRFQIKKWPSFFYTKYSNMVYLVVRLKIFYFAKSIAFLTNSKMQIQIWRLFFHPKYPNKVYLVLNLKIYYFARNKFSQIRACWFWIYSFAFPVIYSKCNTIFFHEVTAKLLEVRNNLPG